MSVFFVAHMRVHADLLCYPTVYKWIGHYWISEKLPFLRKKVSYYNYQEICVSLNIFSLAYKNNMSLVAAVDVALLALSKLQNDPVKKDLLVMSIQSRIDELDAFCAAHDAGILLTLSM